MTQTEEQALCVGCRNRFPAKDASLVCPHHIGLACICLTGDGHTMCMCDFKDCLKGHSYSCQAMICPNCMAGISDA